MERRARTNRPLAPRHVDCLALAALMVAMRDLVQRARSGGLRGSELTDPTITVTSLSERGAESVWGVIYPPPGGHCRLRTGIAPEADFSRVGESQDLRALLDLDSMDFLNFIIGLSERCGVSIPEAD